MVGSESKDGLRPYPRHTKAEASTMSNSSDEEAEGEFLVYTRIGPGTTTPREATPTPTSTERAQETRTDESAWEAAREKLKRAECIDEATVNKLIELDPTPLDSLPLKTKLMRSSFVVQQMLRPHLLQAHHPGVFSQVAEP